MADGASLTRQTISAIENRRYVPSTTVALRLARALGCQVEDLFSLPELDTERRVEIAAAGTVESERVALAQVRGRLVAHPLADAGGVQEGFVSADAMLDKPRGGGSARLLVDPARLDRSGLVMGCDPSLGIVCAHLGRHGSDVRMTWLSGSSRRALDALARGEAHVAGSHLLGAHSGQYNVSQARDVLGAAGGLVIGLARWEQGLVVEPGNPLDLQGVEDLTRPAVRIVNREPGAGCRDFLDVELARLGILSEDVRGYSLVVNSHWAVARSVAGGGADAGVALRAAAQACGLDFVPLSEVHFDLVVPGDLLDHPAVEAMLDVLQTRGLRDELRALPGYDVSATGQVVAHIPGAA